MSSAHDDRVPDAIVPPATGACLAPRSALYFRPDGHVASCCGAWQFLGRVTGPRRRSIREIWEGAAAAELRSALDAGDFGLGCWECGRAAAQGQRESSLAQRFDRFERSARPEHPRLMDFALSNRCNLQCAMCNGGLSSSIRAERERRAPLPAAYDDRFFEELGEFLPHLERAQFKGGEPFLARENRRIWDHLLELGSSPEVSVTTNGTIWSDRVERYVRDLSMEVIVSVDAIDPSELERIRVGVHADQLWRNVDRFQEAVQAGGGDLILCMCLMSDNWRELHPFLVEADRRGVGASVIWVDGPAEHHLLGLGRDDLAEVLGHWESVASSHPSLEPSSAAIWEDALGRVDGAIRAAPSGATPVELADRGATTAAVDAYRAELAAVTGSELLELDLVDEVIEAVRAPAWSQWLAPQGWIGVGLDEFTAHLSSHVDGALRYEVEPGEHGVHRSSATFRAGDEVTCLRFWYVPTRSSGPRRTSHILLGATTARLATLAPGSVPQR